MDSRIYLQIMKEKGESRKHQSDAEATVNVQRLVELEHLANEELEAECEFGQPVVSRRQ